LAICLCVGPLACLIMKLPASKIILTKAKLCNTLLRMVLVCISIYIKSFLAYTVLILDTYHPDTTYVREQGLRIRGHFSKPKRVREEKTFGQHYTKLLIKLYIYILYIYMYVYLYIYIYIYMGRVAQSV